MPSAKRSFTGHHTLLPAMRAPPTQLIPKVPTYTFLKWTFGRGSVIWKIWPAVLLHTAFAAAVVYTSRSLQIPNVMLTVMGVVIGFVISYRAMTGYDRYWMGRTAWTDVIRNARTMGRLIWYHVPPRLTPFVAGDLSKPGVEEMSKVMAEKRMALDLTEAFAVALKHHLRGELGIYYEDLYDLIKPLHDFEHGTAPTVASAAPPLVSSPTDSTATSAPTPPTAAGTYGTFPTASSASTSTSTSASSTSTATLKPTSHASKRPSPTPAQSTTATATEPAPAPSASTTSLRRPLLPASNPTHEGGALLGRVAPEMIAFAGVFTSLARFFAEFRHAKHEGGEGGVKGKVKKLKNKVKHATHTWAGPIHAEADLAEYEKGENLPEEVLRVLSEWVSVLEVRGSVPGASLGNILAGIQQFEMSLTLLEHILTTPLPFVYSVHIRHVVWLYLFLLPLQLVSDFGWHTVPAVSVGAFVYLGFVAAGEEIEQPFGYDDNDLDLDMFCRDIIRQDVQALKDAPCLNAYLPASPSSTSTLSATSTNFTSALGVANGSGLPHRTSMGSLAEAAGRVEVAGAEVQESEDSDSEDEGEGEGEVQGGREGNLIDVR